MYQLKDQRQIKQEYCRELEFNCISFHGNVSVEDELPDQFKVLFVPASLERMLTA